VSSTAEWVDWILPQATGMNDEDGLKSVISTLAYLADEHGRVLVRQVEEFMGLPPGILRNHFGDAEVIVLQPG
jgi:hypothetical protein